MARKTVSQKKAEPGANVKAGFDAQALPGGYSEEETARKQAEFEARGPVVEVITDEWYGQLEEGNPFDETARPFVEGNPDKHFRFLSPLQMSKRGKRGYQEVRKSGEVVKCAGLPLAFIPREVHETRQRKVVSEAMDALDTSRDNYQEQQNRASVESGGAISPLPSEHEVFEGNRRVVR